MASLQERSGSWRVIFRHNSLQHFVTIGKVEETEAQGVKARFEYLLRLLRQRLLTLPAGMDIVTFLRLDGKPADATAASSQPEITFAEFRAGYLKTIGNGAVENNTLYTSKIHLSHLAATLGERFLIPTLHHADLQRHINRRSPTAAAVTIKKELDTLRSAWHWAKRMGHVQGDFPGAGLVYPKGEEKLPFMTWREIERRIEAGGDPDDLWECLYLREKEIEQFLDFVQKRNAPAWVYPMCVMAAHTGAQAVGDDAGRAAGRRFRVGYIHYPRKKAGAGQALDPARTHEFTAERCPGGSPGRQRSTLRRTVRTDRSKRVHSGRRQAFKRGQERKNQGPHRSQAPHEMVSAERVSRLATQFYFGVGQQGD